MGGVIDFLFDGKPPPSVTTYGSSTTNVPQWLSDYTQGILGQGNIIAGQPYQPYEGSRIAGFTPEQQQAFALTQGNVGKGSGIASGGVSGTQGVLGTLMPTLAGNLEGAGRTFTGSTVGQYMNPYAENVTKRAQELANRNFTENLLPGIQNTFTRAGQYGSTRMAEAVTKGARDVSENLQSAADASLADAYKTGASTFASDAGRQGNLAQLGVSGGLQGAGQLGQLGSLMQSLGLSDAASLGAVGEQKQGQNQKNLDLAYSDFQQQRDYPKQQLDWLSNLVHGIPNSAVPQSTTTTQTGPSDKGQGPSFVGQLGSLLSLLKGAQEAWGGNKDTQIGDEPH